MRTDSGRGGSGRGSITAFFALTFGFTWALQMPGVLVKEGLLPGRLETFLPFAMLGIFGPLVAATMLTAREGGKRAVRELYARLAVWRVPLVCYGVAVLPAFLLTAGLWCLGLAGREGPLAYMPDGGRLLVGVVISVAEEVGWRGYALPRLKQRMPAFAASGVVGMLWTLWHVPMFVAMDVPLSLLLVMALFFTGGSLVFTWLYDRSGGSLLIVVLAHFVAHVNNSHAALPADLMPLLVHTVALAGLGLWLMRPSLARATPGGERGLGRKQASPTS